MFEIIVNRIEPGKSSIRLESCGAVAKGLIRIDPYLITSSSYAARLATTESFPPGSRKRDVRFARTRKKSKQAMADIPLGQIKPSYPARNRDTPEDRSIQSLIDQLGLQPHPEGGYFIETDRNPLKIANPFQSHDDTEAGKDTTRSASSTISYLLTPRSSLSAFHRNQSRTIHTWQRGRGRYVVIGVDKSCTNTDKMGSRGRIESFVVGPNVELGERTQWTVEGGNYKSSFLLPDKFDDDYPDGEDHELDKVSEGLLINEVRTGKNNP